jgi:hypothetical protein
VALGLLRDRRIGSRSGRAVSNVLEKKWRQERQMGVGGEGETNGFQVRLLKANV